MEYGRGRPLPGEELAVTVSLTTGLLFNQQVEYLRNGGVATDGFIVRVVEPG